MNYIVAAVGDWNKEIFDKVSNSMDKTTVYRNLDKLTQC